MTTWQGRLRFYVIGWLIAGAWTMARTIGEANTSSDPSSLAWLAFLPYIFPLFWFQAAIAAIPVAIGIEVVCLLISILGLFDDDKEAYRDN